MALNSSCQPVLSCEDSPLSITGSLIGILTLAYAIIITVLYHMQELGSANRDTRRIGRKIEREFLLLRSLFQWIGDMRGPDDKFPEFRYIAESLEKEAREVFSNSVKLLGYSVDEDSGKWKLLIERGRFLSRKTEIQKDLDDILLVRSSLEAISQRLANRITLDKVQKQSETFESYCASMKNQKAMLRRVMNTLHLDAMDEPSEEDSVPNSIAGELEMDGIDMEMRPPTQWDPPGPQTDAK